jgi:hypothetical protein
VEFVGHPSAPAVPVSRAVRQGTRQPRSRRASRDR